MFIKFLTTIIFVIQIRIIKKEEDEQQKQTNMLLAFLEFFVAMLS